MNIKVDRDICQRAIHKWGKDAQMNMVVEECLELASAILKLKTRTDDWEKHQQRIIDVHDEAADVIIMMEQVKMMLGPELIQSRVDFKLNRLKEKLDKKPF